MPLIPGKGHIGENIGEFRTGPTYAHTEEKYGKADAEAQALAVSLSQERKSGSAKPKKRQVHDDGHWALKAQNQ
jgi:hypothetical protein